MIIAGDRPEIHPVRAARALAERVLDAATGQPS
jgi:hypothetical protein